MISDFNQTPDLFKDSREVEHAQGLTVDSFYTSDYEYGVDSEDSSKYSSEYSAEGL